MQSYSEKKYYEKVLLVISVGGSDCVRCLKMLPMLWSSGLTAALVRAGSCLCDYHPHSEKAEECL